MSVTYKVTITLDNLPHIADVIEGQMMARISHGVGKAARDIAGKWREAVRQAPGIWQPERDAYYLSIDWRWLDTARTSAVVETTLPLADEIENGRPAKDLKRMLDSSPKVRQGKKGRYLIIPFRHNTPKATALAPAMPRGVYAQAKRLAPSTIIGDGTRVSGTGAMDVKTRQYLTVPQQKYAWGGSLPAGLAPKLKPSHAADPYAGMKRFDTTTGKAKSSAYLTFRVMSEHSAGWIVPAKPGLHLARDIAREVNKAVEDGIKEAD